MNAMLLCRSCRSMPDIASRKNADGERWVVACTRCNLFAVSVVSANEAIDGWNAVEERKSWADGPIRNPPRVRAKLKFAHNRRKKETTT